MARYHHHRRGQSGAHWILARRSAYHGIGYGSGTATGYDSTTTGSGRCCPHVRHLTPPWPYRSELFDGRDPTDFCLRRAGAHDRRARRRPDRRDDRRADHGRRPACSCRPTTTGRGCASCCAARDPADLRRGRDRPTAGPASWFAAQHFGVEPDLIVTAKGITSGLHPAGRGAGGRPRRRGARPRARLPDGLHLQRPPDRMRGRARATWTSSSARGCWTARARSAATCWPGSRRSRSCRSSARCAASA